MKTLNEFLKENKILKRAIELQDLFMTNKSKFFNMIKGKLKFSYSVGRIKNGNALHRYDDNEYCLILANPKDIMDNTDSFQKLGDTTTFKNHIGNDEIKSRIFTISAHILDGGQLDSPEIYVNKYGTVIFVDGRHRTILAIETKMTEIPFVTEKECLNNITFKYKMVYL